MSDTLEIYQISHEDFAAPNCTVCTVSGAIRSNPNNRARELMFGKDAGNVCMMVLNAHLLRYAAFKRVLIGEVLRMQIKGDGPRFLKICAAVRYDPADLAAFIKAGRRNSTSDPGAEVS